VLRGVSLSYTGNCTLYRDLDLSVARGEVLALTGPSGGGKSTLLHLLAGFLSPDAGTVEVFGEAPGQRPFGWLGQSVFFVQGSWADNLRFAVPELDDTVLRDCLRRAGLGELLDSRPGGIHSPLTEGGRGLSGGQARRLGLARIFAADYPLVLLDEPTAGLDAESEARIIESIGELRGGGRTVVLATHQPALTAMADRVLHVAAGEIRDA
jgi:ATP-binding cassette subfamily C protein CydD